MKHSIDAMIRRLRHPRRAPDGRFETLVDAVRRDMIQGDNIQALINLQEPYQGRPELITAEGCAVV